MPFQDTDYEHALNAIALYVSSLYRGGCSWYAARAGQESWRVRWTSI